MKRKLVLLIGITLVTAAVFLTACSAGDMTGSGGAVAAPEYAASGYRDYGYADDAKLYNMAPAADYDSAAPQAMPPAEEWAGGDSAESVAGTGTVSLSAPAAEELAEKIIYSYHAEIETLKFDETLEKVEKLISGHGAFIENSNISGQDYAASYYGRSAYRSAYFTIRVPVSQLTTVTAQLDSLGYVVSQRSFAENITSQFFDTQSRLNSLRIQEERLLDMLTKAEDVKDMITIEESLANVRYQIESYTATLTNWQRQVDYSTLTLYISEVEEYQEFVPIQRTYWEKMSDGIQSTLRSVGRFFTDLFLWLVVSSPVLIILAVIAIVVIIIVKRKIRKNKEKRRNMQNMYAAQYPAGQYPAAPQYPAYTPAGQQPAAPADSQKTEEGKTE